MPRPSLTLTTDRLPGPFPADRRCKHIDEEKAGQLGFDEEGRCITRLHRNHEGDHCHPHEGVPHRREQTSDSEVRETMEAAA